MNTFTRFAGKTDNISALPDRPKLEDGYTPVVIKALFDKAPSDIKAYINEVLLPSLESVVSGKSGAERIGSAQISGLASTDVYGVLCELKALCSSLDTKIDETVTSMVAGAIPDGSLSESKLTQALADKINAAIIVSGAYTIFKTAGSASFTVPKTGYYKVCLQGAGGGGTLNTSYFVNYATYECVGGPSGSYCEAILQLCKGDIITLSVGEGGAGAGNSLFTLDGTTTVSNYNTLYCSTTLHNSPGGATVFGSGENIISAPGGTRLSSASVPVATGIYSPSLTLVKAGRICADFFNSGDIVNGNSYAGGIRYYMGAESFSGSGADIIGASAVSPGFGGGGLGGRWYFDGSTTLTFRRQSGKGGDGLIIIEYVQ
ncbi:MAG: hypothetical protein VB118_12095 [Oscillospiraceae bacterium]|nr:hypothetical protein [Oscillospiraceae bacterium]